jgi:hypothetical protein
MEPHAVTDTDHQFVAFPLPLPTGSEARDGPPVRRKKSKPLESEISDELMNADVHSGHVTLGNPDDQGGPLRRREGRGRATASRKGDERKKNAAHSQ